MKLKSYILAVVFIYLFSLSIFGDIYYYKDEEGVYHFTNIPPVGKDKHKFKIYLRTPPIRIPKPWIVAVPPKDHSPERFNRYDEIITEASMKYLIPVALIKAIIKVESDFNPDVVSPAGAMGLMQLMPQTAEAMGVKNIFDPRENIMGGTRYLRILANKYKGDLVLTLAAYNAGEGAVDKYGGMPPYMDTYTYVKNVLKYYYEYKKIYTTKSY